MKQTYHQEKNSLVSSCCNLPKVLSFQVQVSLERDVLLQIIYVGITTVRNKIARLSAVTMQQGSKKQPCPQTSAVKQKLYTLTFPP